MSIRYCRNKKNKKRILDGLNPERKRVRRMIREGKLPRRAFEKCRNGGKEFPVMRKVPGSRQTELTHKVKTETVRRFLQPWKTFDIFQTLTKKEQS